MLTELTSRFDEAAIARLRDRFAGVGCAQLADAAPEFVRPLRLPLAPRNGHPQVCGPLFPVSTNDDMLPCLQALAAAPPGWVVFIANEVSPSEALAGDIYTASACVQRLGGIVVDGAVRDLADIDGMPVPVFSTQVTFVSARTADVPARQVPDTLTVGGCELRPGDWVFGDPDGFLVLAQEHVTAVLAAGAVLRQREERLRAAMRTDNATLAELTGLADFLAGRGPLKFNP